MHRSDGPDKRMNEMLYLTDDGLQFDNSILWLDSQKSGKYSFLSSASSLKDRYNSQVIVSEETHELLKLHNPELKSLICQYNRPFSLGRYDLELIPSGSALGASSLSIETGSERILYAPSLCDYKHSLARGLQLKPVDYLVLQVDHCDPLKPFWHLRKKEQQRLLEGVEASLAQGKKPVVFTPLLHTASELTAFFSENGISVFAHKVVFDINKIYQRFGHNVGEFELLNLGKESPQKGVYLVPPSFRSKKIFLSNDNHALFYISDRGENVSASSESSTFDIQLPERNTNLSKIIKQIAPKKTFLFGPYATRFLAQSRTNENAMEIIHPFHQVSLL